MQLPCTNAACATVTIIVTAAIMANVEMTLKSARNVVDTCVCVCAALCGCAVHVEKHFAGIFKIEIENAKFIAQYYVTEHIIE